MPKKFSKSTISKGLQAIDLFEDSIHLNVDGEDALKTSFGGLISLAIVIFLLVQAILESIQVFNRDNPAIVQMKEIENDPLLIALNSTNNAIFAIGVTQDNANVNLSSSSPISFVAQYTHQLRSNDGKLTKQKTQILWGPCVKTNFSSSVFPENTFSSYSLQYAYCPTMINFTDMNTGICPETIKKNYPTCLTPFEFGLQGNFLSVDFSYLQVSVHSCDPADSATIQDLTCTSDTASNIFANSEIKLNLYYSSILIDPTDYKMPNKSYIDTIYWSINPSVYKLADIYVEAVTVQDYDSLTSESKYTNRTFYSLGIESMRETQVFNRTDMLELNFRRSNSNTIVIRKYDKIIAVISSIGGISQVLLVVGAVIALGYSRYKHQMLLSNRFYDFPDSKPKVSKSPITLKDVLHQNEEIKNDSVVHQLTFSPSKNKIVVNDETINDYFGIRNQKDTMLKFGMLNFLKSLYNQLTCKQDPNDQLAHKARLQVTRDLDIGKIVEKLKEIDKLKMIFLNRYQREAFDFLEKPHITLKDEKPIHRDSSLFMESPEDSPVGKNDQSSFDVRQEFDAMTKYKKLYTAYTFLNADHDPRNWKFNKKILNMIGEDLIKIFKRVDDYLGDDPDPRRFGEAIQKIINGEPGSQKHSEPIHLETFGI